MGSCKQPWKQRNMKLTLLFCAIFALSAYADTTGAPNCVKAQVEYQTPSWEGVLADNTAANAEIMADAKAQVEAYNKNLYAKYTEAEILNLKELAEKFDDKLVEKFEKIEQFKQ